MLVLGVMMALLFSVFDQINKAWLQGENRVETFTDARAALDLMSRELSQAIATPSIAFNGTANAVNFVAPVSSNPQNQADLCEVGYWYIPGTSPSPIIRHFIEPNSVNIGGNWNIYSPTWWTEFGTAGVDEMASLTGNTVLNLSFQYGTISGGALTFSPTWTATPNNLPYAIVINMGMVDSRTAAKLSLVPNTGNNWASITNSTLRNFSTTVYLPNTLP